MSRVCDGCMKETVLAPENSESFFSVETVGAKDAKRDYALTTMFVDGPLVSG